MTSIFVAKLDFGVSSDQLRQAFQQYGTVLKATVATDRETGKSRGFGFVEMADREEALNAIKMLDGYQFNGRPITVKEAEQRTDSRPPRDSNYQGGDRSKDNGQYNKPSFNRTENQGGEFRKPSTYQRDNESSSDFRKPIDRDFVPPAIDPLKPDLNRKKDKEKEKKGKSWDTESQSGKKPKMSAYKKSGKNNKFFGDEDDDDWDDNSADDLVDNSYGDEENSLGEDEDFYDEEGEDNED